MTLHAFSKSTNASMKWVALPLEFVDWMAVNFDGTLLQYLRRIDPYASVRLPDSITGNAVEELARVRNRLECSGESDIPRTVDLFGNYGRSRALTTVNELLEFFEFASQTPCKIVSVGD